MILESLVKDPWNLVFGITGLIGLGGSLYLFGKDIYKEYKITMKNKEKETITVYDVRIENNSEHPKNFLSFFGLTK